MRISRRGLAPLALIPALLGSGVLTACAQADGALPAVGAPSIVAATGTPPPAARPSGVSTTDAVALTPGGLPRGAAPGLPWAVQDVLHDGDRTVDLGGYTDVLGRSDTAVIAYVSDRHTDRIVAVRDAGGRLLLDRVPGGQGAAVSEDGRLLYVLDTDGPGNRLRVLATEDGHEVAARPVPAGVIPLGAADDVVYLRGNGRTLRWTVGSPLERISDGDGYLASPGADLIASMEEVDGLFCSTLVRASDPTTVVWHSCRERVVAVSPDGERMVTAPWRDHAGGSRMLMRTVSGDLIARYAGQDAWFDRVRFEDDTTALLRVSTGRRSAYVRCDGEDCERATGVSVEPSP